jgi:hypothetical protein
VGRTGALIAVAALGLLSGCGPLASAPAHTTVAPRPAVSHAAAPAPITYPAAGHRKYRTAAGSKQAGTRGPLLRYRVLVETDIKGVRATTFADAVTKTLNDPRGWKRKLRRSGPGEPYDFTIYLATPRTRDRLCGSSADGYTSCRNGDKVVLNVARWVKGVPGYGASLATYRQYMVNHEVGHRFGHGHERCPGKGEPAPVMQQQTLGLHGCVANPWPYLHGERYAGVSGAYDDAVPAPDRGRTRKD